MQIHSSLEQAVTELVSIIMPLGTEFGSPSPKTVALSILQNLKLTLMFIAVRILTLALLYLTLQLTLRAIGYVMTNTIDLLRLFIVRMTHRSTAPKSHTRRRPTTRIVEDDSAFESWEEFRRRFTTWEHGGHRDPEVHRALVVLGVPPFATKGEIRTAYLHLMKRYHPDRLTGAPSSERQHGEKAAVRVRQAYDTLRSLQCQARQV